MCTGLDIVVALWCNCKYCKKIIIIIIIINKYKTCQSRPKLSTRLIFYIVIQASYVTLHVWWGPCCRTELVFPVLREERAVAPKLPVCSHTDMTHSTACHWKTIQFHPRNPVYWKHWCMVCVRLWVLCRPYRLWTVWLYARRLHGGMILHIAGKEQDSGTQRLRHHDRTAGSNG